MSVSRVVREHGSGRRIHGGPKFETSRWGMGRRLRLSGRRQPPRLVEEGRRRWRRHRAVDGGGRHPPRHVGRRGRGIGGGERVAGGRSCCPKGLCSGPPCLGRPSFAFEFAGRGRHDSANLFLGSCPAVCMPTAPHRKARKPVTRSSSRISRLSCHDRKWWRRLQLHAGLHCHKPQQERRWANTRFRPVMMARRSGHRQAQTTSTGGGPHSLKAGQTPMVARSAGSASEQE